MRIRLERGDGCYQGNATTKDATWALSCAIDAAGEVTVTSDSESVPEDVKERARLMVRIEVRNARATGARLPRVIQRWRAQNE